MTEVGGLMSYAPNLLGQYQSAAAFVDKILKGDRASESPVQWPTRFDLVVNLKSAQTLGLAVPPSFLAQVTELIQ